MIDGVLVPAELLVNGTTITRDETREYDELEFFHVKLESHDVIYAEGAPAETLVEVNEFAVNFADYLRQYGTVHDRGSSLRSVNPCLRRTFRAEIEAPQRSLALDRSPRIRLTWFATDWRNGDSTAWRDARSIDAKPRTTASRLVNPRSKAP